MKTALAVVALLVILLWRRVRRLDRTLVEMSDRLIQMRIELGRRHAELEERLGPAASAVPSGELIQIRSRPPSRESA